MTVFVRISLALAAILAVVVLVGAGGGPQADRYRIELDNAFGLTTGSEIRVAGVAAGTLQSIELDEDSLRPIVGFEITEDGFGDLRRDAECQARPQSLIGEYFLDCQPGTGEPLPPGGLIPVEQTTSVVPPDLIQNIMRRPYRERFSILLSELGMALAGRGEDLNEVIRRASPALRETNRVLDILVRQRRTIQDLYRSADAVLAEVAQRRDDVATFVREARDTAGVYASRADAVDEQLRTLPAFLDELRPTLAALQGTADAQRPALSSLRAAAPALSSTLRTSAAFATAARPSVRSLAGVARRGREAVRVARPVIGQLARAIEPLPETAGNLGIILDHLDDPRFAIEPDARAPRPEGFTGLENVVRFGFGQSQTTNWLDDDSYLLKVVQYADAECGEYAGAERAATLPGRCHAWMGPTQPGVNTTDPTRTEPAAPARRAAARPQARVRRPATTLPAAPVATVAPAASTAPVLPSATPVPRAPAPGSGTLLDLLDFLLGS